MLCINFLDFSRCIHSARRPPFPVPPWLALLASLSSGHSARSPSRARIVRHSLTLSHSFLAPRPSLPWAECCPMWVRLEKRNARGGKRTKFERQNGRRKIPCTRCLSVWRTSFSHFSRLRIIVDKIVNRPPCTTFVVNPALRPKYF